MGIETKAMKYAYNREVMYKIALPSAVSDTQQCWISKNQEQWRMVMGANAEQAILKDLITAIKNQEQMQGMYAASVARPELRSA
jgi:hypothetical protein